MKKFLFTLAALFALPALAIAQYSPTYTAQAGITLAVQSPATVTFTSPVVRLPNFNAAGTLTVVGAGITGSPSGCQVRLYYQTNAGGNTSVISTTAITPATSTQTFSISPSIANGDNVYAIYNCTVTYPTAGLISMTLSPSGGAGGAVTITSGAVTTITNPVTVNQANTPGTTDPCLNPSLLKSSAIVNISGAAGTTELVAPSGSKAVYLCYFHASFVGTAPTYYLEYGISTACTGTTALTGTMAVPTTTFDTLGHGNGSVVATPASQGLCLVAGGTTPSIQGVITYVQQ